MADDDGTFIVGTVVNKAFVDQVYDQIDAQTHSAANTTITPKATTDEVVAARGSKPTLDARLDTSLNEDGTLKTQAGVPLMADLQALLGSRNVIINGDLDDWSAGASAAPDNWTLNGAAATVVRTGPGEADTFTFGAGKFAAKVTRVGNDANLEQIVIAAADFAGFAEIKGRKVGFAVKVKATVAAQTRITVDDGATQTNSAFHTGGGVAEHLTALHTVSSSATKLHVKLEVLTTNGAATFGGIQMVFSETVASDWQPLSQPPSASSIRRGLVDLSQQDFTGLKRFSVPPAFKPGASTGGFDATVSGRVASMLTAVGNVGAGEDQLFLYTLPANSLNADGKLVRIVAWGRNLANANAKRIRLRLNDPNATLFDSTAKAFNDHGWHLEVVLMRTSAAPTQIAHSVFLTGVEATSLTAADSFAVSNLNHTQSMTAAMAFKITGEGVVDNDIILKGAYVEVIG